MIDYGGLCWIILDFGGFFEFLWTSELFRVVLDYEGFLWIFVDDGGFYRIMVDYCGSTAFYLIHKNLPEFKTIHNDPT